MKAPKFNPGDKTGKTTALSSLSANLSIWIERCQGKFQDNVALLGQLVRLQDRSNHGDQLFHPGKDNRNR